MHITAYLQHHRDSVLELSIRAWAPVFATMRDDVPGFVYDNFYPQGWEARQRADLAAILDGQPEHCTVAIAHEEVVGWVCTRIHPEDNMGEVHVLAVEPAGPRHRLGTAQLGHASAEARAAGLDLVMVETGGDAGHAPARAQYESAGFTRWPVARYFREL